MPKKETSHSSKEEIEEEDYPTSPTKVIILNWLNKVRKSFDFSLHVKKSY